LFRRAPEGEMMSLEPKLLQARLVQAKEAEMQAAEAATQKAERRCERAFERLGAEKARTMEEGLAPFDEAFSRLQNVRLHVEIGDEGVPDVDEVAVAAAGRLTASVMDMVGATAVAGAASAGAVTGTMAAVAAFGTASTGTAIGGLSGAAATNATLAWLGGGSLAAGGGGVAAGTAELAGVAAAPVVVVGAVFLHLKGRQAIAKAETFAADVDRAVAEHRQRRLLLRAAAKMSDGIGKLLAKLLPHLRAETAWLARKTKKSADWDALSERERERIRRVAAIAVGTADLVHTPVLAEDGSLTAGIRAAYERGQVLAGEAS
jgi:hypothetical protein